MRNALVALTAMAVVSGAALVSGAQAAPTASLSAINAGAYFETAAYRRAPHQVRQNSNPITSFSSSSPPSAGVNHPPKR
jgi:hypothetical protein